MSAEIIQVEYESLKAIAVRFDRASEQSGALRGRLDSCAHRLRESWRGAAAIAFFGEMDHALLPALNRLGGALSDAAATTREIGETMRAAEEEAAALFKVESIKGVAKQPDPAASVDLDDPPLPANTDPAVAYAPVLGKPFVGGVHPNDVRQGYLGDCYLLASLASIAQQNPDVIKNMIRDNGDGTYTVTFHQWTRDGLQPIEITVDDQFPMKNGVPYYAGVGDGAGDSSELWVMIVEKAYAQWSGGYGHIEGGWPHDSMEAITGVPSQHGASREFTIDELATYHEEGYALSVATEFDWRLWRWDIPDVTDGPLFADGGGDLYPSHAYYITRVDREAGTITIRNPWGWDRGELTYTLEEFHTAFSTVSLNPIHVP